MHEDTGSGTPRPYLYVVTSPLQFGFACVWDRNGDRERTWSHTPMRLWDALARRPDVALRDVPVRVPNVPNLIGAALSYRLAGGKPVSTWRMRPWYAELASRDLRRSLAGAGMVDAVLSIGEHGSIDRPLYIYQDHCFGHGLEMYRKTGVLPFGWEGTPLSTIERRAAMQAETYASAHGVFSMSRWNADYLVRAGLVEASRAHAVHSGINVPVVPPSHDDIRRKRSRAWREVLFVGRDFFRKGGDLVVQAFELARRSASTPIRLVVAGPTTWPSSIPMPPDTEFLGDLAMSAVRERLRSADVLVMPSHFEAFGIIFVEALASGVPAIGRRAFAMPEMIDHGRNGYLVETDDVTALAEMIVRTVDDEKMAFRCCDDAPNVSAYFAWDRVASDMVATVTSEVR